ncbi:MAG: prepilin peptidase [Pirellulaceae bacterium]|nr:prepilin peptidase [Pirellulaceae bacterium]
MPRRKRRNWPFQLAIFAAAGSLLAYAVLWPLVSALLAPARTLASRPLPILAPLSDQIPIRVFEFFILAWLFVFGSCIGSFLNVVIYRTPRRLSLWGSSHCPRCRVRIPARDNVPVFGWLKLRGRCRTCRLPISARYPLVELTVGLVILALATLEILLAGINLPDVGHRDVVRLSVSWLVGHPRWDLIGTCVLHCGLVGVLLSWALIRYDTYAVPIRYAVGAFGAAWLLTVSAPLLRPEAWPSAWLDWHAWLSGWTNGGRGLPGMIGGLFLGLLVVGGCRLAGRDRLGRKEQAQEPMPDGNAREAREPTPKSNFWDAPLGLGLVGVCLGWPAAVSVGLLASAARLLGALTLGISVRRRPAPLLAYVCLAAFLHVCLWRGLDSLAFWPGDSAGLPAVVTAITMIVVLTWQASVLERLVSTP